MARIAGGIGAPHTPVFPAHVARLGPECEEARLYRELDASLEAMRADALVVFSNDHFNTFFFDNFPLLAIGVADATSGPNDQTPMPSYDLPVHGALAAHLRACAIRSGFDIAVTQEFTLDHAFLVPLHFLGSVRRTPIIPVFIDAFSNPLPSPARIWALGETLRAAVESWHGDERIAALGSGSFSLEIGGPLADRGERSGTPDAGWSQHVQARMEAGEYRLLIEEASPQRLALAGNAAGELLNWLAMIAFTGGGKPRFMRQQAKHGHAFGVWET